MEGFLGIKRWCDISVLTCPGHYPVGSIMLFIGCRIFNITFLFTFPSTKNYIPCSAIHIKQHFKIHSYIPLCYGEDNLNNQHFPKT